ncbi:RecF/RecN/SMC [Sphaerosporella brunnea]|uniref:Structural maintenance of chromosomes protein n=1 Tax=Sphaerosporella brunnea TaxID=1250544 RepID=A0A5J5F0I2_9PEZI|nr:RecF/RecN/SMC [Sphaerosporella brunnea]
MGKLLRLELLNFKSYKGHQIIHFGDDSYFTSIIGPNGSGKSNSMDAISFVLGIKSSHLRSAHLRDLIYRGRKLRSPDAADDGGTQTQRDDPKSAWVMAVYIDDDDVEHRWKRTITAQGASEYRINDRPVTAAQYNEALEKQNILIRARNFLVFQGDVEAIASQKPEDLTRLIEQISGSLDYKAEYERLQVEQEKAADLSSFNLNRRRGINAEIKQYQEQKKEAEQYQAKMQERDEAIVTHILWKLFHFQQTMEKNKTEIEKHQHELKEFRRSHHDSTENLKEAKAKQAKANKAVLKQEGRIREKEKELEEMETSLVPINEKNNISDSHMKKCSSRITEIKRDQDTQTATVKSLEKELGVVKKAQAQFLEAQQKAAKETGIALSEADLAQYNKLKEQVNTKIASQQIEIDNLSREQKTDVETVNSLNSKVESTEWQLSKLKTEVGGLKKRREEAEATVTQITKEIDDKTKRYNTVTSDRTRNAQKHEELEGKLKECLGKLLEADDGRRQSEREIKVKETINTLKRIFPGVKGRISELCKPKLKKFSEAVSTVLGRHFDAVVVDNEKTAKDCIEYLREQRMGQATFLPLETIQVKALNSNLKGMHRGMRMAIDTIEFDSSVERAMLYVCGNAVVCDDLQVAKYICYDKELEVKAVTVDGTVIHKGGLMTGGRVGNGSGRRWEDQDVESLRHTRDKLMAQISALPKNRRSAEQETLDGELTGLKERKKYHEDDIKHVERTLTAKEKEILHLQQTLAELKPKLTDASASLESINTKLTELQKVVSEEEDEIFRPFCSRLGFPNIKIYEQQQGSLQQEVQQRKLEFATQIRKIESQLVFETGRLKQTKERIETLKKLADRDRAMLKELDAQKQEIQKAIDNIKKELDVMKKDLERRRADLEKQATKVAEAKREVAKRFGDMEETNRTIAALESGIERNAAGRYNILRRCKLEEIQITLTEDSAPIDDLPIKDTFQEEPFQPHPEAMEVDEEGEEGEGVAGSPFGKAAMRDYGIKVDFDELSEELREDGSEKVEEELLDKIKTLSSELDRMAPNMKAIERLEGVESRLTETDKEFEESRQAAKTAKEKFQAVREKRFGLFKKAFKHIKDEIGKVYKELTKSSVFPQGGIAYLDLEDSEEPVSGGIKYHAIPPGKRFRDMDLLSGGEKTMAALALLFAIHSFQPSPFFVLDEVDAALDNANVQKIANYIRKHSGPGMQFIVISLKAGLFQQSDALVGIYRDQTECSSRSLTLDLRQYDQQEKAQE